MKLLKEVDEALAIPQQHPRHGLGFGRLDDEHFEDVKGFVLDVAAFVLHQVHGQLEIVGFVGESDENVEIRPFDEQLGQEAQREAFGDHIVRVKKSAILI